MSDDPKIAQLERELAAARQTIATLIRRVEIEENRPGGMDRHAVLKAMANLESMIDHRTQELETSERRFRALYDHAPAPVVTVDGQGALTDANQTFAHSFNEPVSELIGRQLASFFTVAGAERVRELLAMGLGEAEGEELRTPDGRSFLLTAAPLLGHRETFQAVLHDVTARRELEAELQHTRRLAAIGHLAAGVAHEINNPLAVIQGRVELIDILGVEVPEVLHKQLEVIGQHARRIARIVRSLQAFARPRGADPEPVSVVDLIRAAREIAGASLSEVTFDIVITPEDLVVQADKWQMERVLVNLFNNAADAMPDGGRITVRAHHVDDVVSIDVSDEGEGIPEDLLDQVFAPFVSGKSRARRSGLGLAITWGIIQEHNGTIRAANVDGAGAMFSITLPAADPDALPDPTIEEPATRADRPLRILCVEDESALVQMVHRMARNAGHSVMTASTGEEGLELARHHDFDVILSDVRLPGMSGMELREQLMEIDKALGTHTVLMSGYFQELPDDVPYLQKPFRRSELLAVLVATANR